MMKHFIGKPVSDFKTNSAFWITLKEQVSLFTVGVFAGIKPLICCLFVYGR